MASWKMGHGARRATFKVGLLIPVSGAAGLWGPSCRACAELAAGEINARGGLAGRQIELIISDAGRSPGEVAFAADALVAGGEIDAIVGMHTSDVREALARVLAGRLPYVYTPLYEGGERAPGVYCIGETPRRHLLLPLRALSARYGLKRWFLLGNDYVWPRTIHRLVRPGITLAGEAYCRFGIRDFAPILARIAESRADAVLVSLIGEDAVMFNRAFAAAGLDGRVLRLSCAVEENVLLAIGAAHTDGLFAAAGYFAGLPTPQNGAFRERYHSRFGERAPALNTIGQSLYEGMLFLETLLLHPSLDRASPVAVGGARKHVGADQTIYLAQAEGHDFRVVQAFPAT